MVQYWQLQYEQFWQQNIVQSCYTAGSKMFTVYMDEFHIRAAKMYYINFDNQGQAVIIFFYTYILHHD